MRESSLSLNRLFRVKSRFHRSIHLERDYVAQTGLEDYVLTPMARAILARVVDALHPSATGRAWTLTGPYGSGKSAFALFVAKAFGRQGDPLTEQARALVRVHDERLYRRLFDRRSSHALTPRGLCQVLVTGSRSPLDAALLKGLERGLEVFWRGPGTKPALLQEVAALRQRVERRGRLSTEVVASLFERVADQVVRSINPGGGLLVIIDELGKFLEFAAQDPDRSDLFLLQSLAEAASRSGDRPILFVTILHQAFERYASRLSATERGEWAKVQGRFEDIAFQETTDQILRLIGAAIQPINENGATKKLLKAHRQEVSKAVELDLGPRNLKGQALRECLSDCAPLHPITALLLGPLFRSKLAQNERSLFAFIASNEAHGFQEFLHAERWHAFDPSPSYRVDRLYDYIVTALGNGLYSHGNGKRWAEVDTAQARLPSDAGELETKLIKAIGILGIIGEQGNLKASKEVLTSALADGQHVTERQVEEALGALVKRSIIIFRRYNETFALWQGSDIDIDAKVRCAEAYIDVTERLSEKLVRLVNPRPLVARRHFIQTGTLRYFEVRFVDGSILAQALEEPLGEADGRIFYVLPNDEEEAARVRRLAEAEAPLSIEHSERAAILIAIPMNLGALRLAVTEVASLQWVRANTPELEGDTTARQELIARLGEAERMLTEEVQQVFNFGDPASNHGCEWYRRGQRLLISSKQDFTCQLSEICDQVYSAAPCLKNELINRRVLSSSAAAARRNLIAAMLTHGDKPHLGLQGAPPELSMYASLLEESGMHRCIDGHWTFAPPDSSRVHGFHRVWQAIEHFLAEAEVERRPVVELFRRLKQPPYGLKDGPLLVLLCAAMLHYDTEIALYEQGSFVPDLSVPVIERLIKAPEKFDLQRCRIQGVRAAVFEHFAATLGHGLNRPRKERPNLLDIVRPLCKFINRLPAYTKQTTGLSERARKLREALLLAREPSRLLFQELPEACGFPPFSADEVRSPEEIETFFKNLKSDLAELQRAYDELLGKIENLLTQAFSLRESHEAGRRELRERASPLFELTVDYRLKSFLLRATDSALDFPQWIESLGTLLAGKPPMSWNDGDLARFEIGLAQLARSFRHFEVLTFDLTRRGMKLTDTDFEALRVGITVPHERERERVVVITKDDRAKVQFAETKLVEALKALGSDGDVELALAVLGRLSQKLLDQVDKADLQDSSE